MALTHYDTNAYFQKNESELAQTIAANKKNLRLNHKDAIAYYNLRSTYYYKYHQQLAIRYLKKAIRYKYDFAKVYNNLGAAYSAIGETNKATKAYNDTL